MPGCRSSAHGWRHRLLAATAVSLALVGWGTATASATGATAPDRARHAAAKQADAGRLVDIGGGRKLFMACRGKGAPTVVLVTGLGERAVNWSATTKPSDERDAVYPSVARFGRVCAYDRPGTASSGPSGPEPTRSTPVPQPTTPRGDAADLRALLQASGERGPFVLVGHSLGGPIVELFASAYPKQVAGLVLVDALSEDLNEGLTPAQLADFEALNSPAVQGRPPGAEDFDFGVLTQQLRAAAPIRKVPTIVLTADQFQITPEAIASGQLPAFVTQEFADALWRSQLAAQDELAAKFPGAEHLTNTNATHYIQNDQPKLVVDSIRDVVRRVRTQ
jgi:pimeloyl-ACP methyl ester carboxylesterase